MIDNFKSFILEKHLFPEGDKVLLAISGGMDSMAMAELFHLSGYHFAFAHCNFKLRGEESDGDEIFVREEASRYGVQCYCREFNTAEIAKERGISIQMAARELRYGFFEEITEKNGFDHIATAHHLDDQTETFFINLIRGCGIAGLHGIRVKNGKIIRPMMFSYRHEIEAFVNDRGVDYREDSSNKSTHYQRNKLRHDIIPVFRELNPNFDAEMADNISRISKTESIFHQHIELSKKDVLKIVDEVAYIDIPELKNLQPISSFLFEFISPYRFKNEDVDNIIASLGSVSGKTFYSPTHQLIIDREKLIISALLNEEGELEYKIGKEDSLIMEPTKMTASVSKIHDFSMPHENNIASLDYKKLQFPLWVRRWETGDSFVPLGMKNHKKLSDFFIDEKYSLLEKQQTWILCSGDDIVWIIGARIDDRYKITKDTDIVYQLKLSK